MNDRFQIQGMWWMPEDPETQVPGTLTFDPDHVATLELLGTFKKGLEELGSYPSLKLMLGFSTDGKSITLRECFETSIFVKRLKSLCSSLALLAFPRTASGWSGPDSKRLSLARSSSTLS
jgi:hypothetical protein